MARKTTKKRIGRPPLGESRKSELLRIRVTKAELKTLKRMAAKAGTSISELLMKPWREEK